MAGDVSPVAMFKLLLKLPRQLQQSGDLKVARQESFWMTIEVFILRVNTNVENWSLNTRLAGIRRNMIHLENSWLLSWKVLGHKKIGV